MKKGLPLLLTFSILLGSGFSVKNLEKEKTRESKAKSSFSVKDLKKEEKKEEKNENLRHPSSYISFYSSDKKKYSFGFNINENFEIEVLSKEKVPPYAIDEAKFVIAFEEFIKKNYGSKSNFINKIDEEIKAINNSVENIIYSLNYAKAIRELGHMAAVNIYSGGLSGEENKAFLQKIATNFVAGIVYDLSQYYGFTSERLEDKIICDIIKTASGLFLSRTIYSNEEYSKKIAEDVMAGFYSEIALGIELMKESKNYINSDNFEELQNAYDRFKYGYVSAWSSLKGLAYLAEKRYDEEISNAFSEIVGSYIKKEIIKRGGGGLFGLLELGEALSSLTSHQLSDEEKSSIIKRAFQQSVSGEALRRVRRSAENTSKIFWYVDMYSK